LERAVLPAGRPAFRLGAVALLALAVAVGCGGDDGSKGAADQEEGSAASPAAPAEPAGIQTPDDLPNGLVLGLAQFAARKPGSKSMPEPMPAAMDFLVRRGGEWVHVTVADPQSNVIHKAMAYPTADGGEAILAAAGSEATLKLWRKGEDGLVSETLWQKDFGGKFSRMRDVEIADLYGDGSMAIAVATHDQGVVAIVRPDPDGGFVVEEIDAEPDTFVHEIEIGDVDGDGTLEVYSTPSEPNRLDGSAQSGIVTRYVPAKGEGRKVVADLGDRHAKEILVDDVDGDGRDELYVVVEGKIEKGSKRLMEPVEILRFEADTDPAEGVVIATIEDRLGRFLTAGDIDGDGRKEIVAALFSQGLWLLRPGDDPMQPWTKKLIDRKSGGFEHAAVLADLDEDGRDELYVASDNDNEVRRYVWMDGEFDREVIFRRTDGNSVFTWNIMAVPVELVP
jgi:hypothetical protein